MAESMSETAPMAESDDLLARLAETEGHSPGLWHREEYGPENKEGTKASLGIWSQALFDAALTDDDLDPMDEAWVCGIWGSLGPEDEANACLIALAPDMKARILSDAATIRRLTGANDALIRERAGMVQTHRENCQLLQAEVSRLTEDRDAETMAREELNEVAGAHVASLTADVSRLTAQLAERAEAEWSAGMRDAAAQLRAWVAFAEKSPQGDVKAACLRIMAEHIEGDPRLTPPRAALASPSPAPSEAAEEQRRAAVMARWPGLTRGEGE